MQQAEMKTDREREEARTVYLEAQPVAVDICDQVEYFYRKDPDPASRRAKCRRWGVVYMYDQNETPDPGDTGGGETGGGDAGSSGGTPPPGP